MVKKIHIQLDEKTNEEFRTVCELWREGPSSTFKRIFLEWKDYQNIEKFADEFNMLSETIAKEEQATAQALEVYQ